MNTTTKNQHKEKNVYEMKKNSCLSMIEKEDIPIEVKAAKKEGIEKAFRFFKGFLAFGISPGLATRCLNHKIKNILDSTTVESVLKNGDFCLPISATIGEVEGYIPEEELIVLAICSKLGHLTDEAQKRYKALYQKCFIERRPM